MFETFVGVANPIAAFSHVTFLGPEPDNMPQDPITGLIVVKAQQCILDLCVREYNVAVSNGTAEINETSITHGERFDWAAPGTGDEFDDLESGLTTGELYCWKGTDTPISDLSLTQVSLLSPYDLASSERKGFVDRANLAFCTYSARYLSGANQQYLHWIWDADIASKLAGTTEAT